MVDPQRRDRCTLGQRNSGWARVRSILPPARRRLMYLPRACRRRTSHRCDYQGRLSPSSRLVCRVPCSSTTRDHNATKKSWRRSVRRMVNPSTKGSDHTRARGCRNGTNHQTSRKASGAHFGEMAREQSRVLSRSHVSPVLAHLPAVVKTQQITSKVDFAWLKFWWIVSISNYYFTTDSIQI